MTAPALSAPPEFVALTPASVQALDELMVIEEQAYGFPWTRRNFEDGLRSGYSVQCLMCGAELLAYYVATAGVDEVHLLNLTVAPAHQRRGHAVTCLRHLTEWAHQDLLALRVWLEVRAGNVRAFQVYERFGFQGVGLRKAYYPNGTQPREDAIVMKLDLQWAP
ncbi:MAG: ribosomal protein S18-alanine N-acetyltransferase [Pseudomonadota bacterium]|jgi:[ribosomal protein S18]-alanine N-acetyltransferase